MVHPIPGFQHGRGIIPPGTYEGEPGIHHRGGRGKDAQALQREVPHARHPRRPGLVDLPLHNLTRLSEMNIA